uniref:Uncharacterized protein n=1 Tax=viral metagenome TaxID=1070528 RepID=A0A6M3IJA2_9ZZZZ
MESKTKKKAGAGAVVVMIAAAALAIMNSNPEDARLPDEAIIAIHRTVGGAKMDAFFGHEFTVVADTVEARNLPGVREYYAVPRSALVRAATAELYADFLREKYPEHEVLQQNAGNFARAAGVPDSVWVLQWSLQAVLRDGEALDPNKLYDGRFGVKGG